MIVVVYDPVTGDIKGNVDVLTGSVADSIVDTGWAAMAAPDQEKGNPKRLFSVDVNASPHEIVAKPPPPPEPDRLAPIQSDPALTLVRQASNVADLEALIAQMGISDPQHRAVMLGLLKLSWLLLRRFT